MTDALKDAVRKRDGGICQVDGKPAHSQIHHILPRSAGGQDTLSNLVLLCGACHMAISPSPNFAKKKAFPSDFITDQDIKLRQEEVNAAIKRFCLKYGYDYVLA